MYSKRRLPSKSLWSNKFFSAFWNFNKPLYFGLRNVSTRFMGDFLKLFSVFLLYKWIHLFYHIHYQQCWLGLHFYNLLGLDFIVEDVFGRFECSHWVNPNMFPSKEHKFIIAFVPALLVLLNLLVFNSTSLLEAKIIVSGFSDTIVCLLSNLGLPKTELYKLAYLFLSEKILYVYCFYF